MAALPLLAAAPLVGVSAYRFVSIGLNTQSWRRLLPPREAPRFLPLLRLRWTGESINSLLPVAQVGGDLVRARLVSRSGVSPRDAAASLAVDLGIGVLTQALFSLAAAVALARLHRPGSGPSAAAPLVLGGLGASLAVLAAVVFLRWGATRAASRLVARRRTGRWARLAGGAEALEQALSSLLRRGRDLACAFAWHLAGWTSHAGETWLFFALAGAPVSPAAALALEGMIAATRGAAFFVPAGLGVQELTVVSLSSWLGLGVDAALALGIAKRVREVAVGVPGILLWLLSERAASRRRRRDA